MSLFPKIHEEGFASKSQMIMPRILGWRAPKHPKIVSFRDTLFMKKNVSTFFIYVCWLFKYLGSANIVSLYCNMRYV